MDIKTIMAFKVSLTLSRLQIEINLSSGLCKRVGSRDIRKNCIFVITLTIASVFTVCLIASKSKVVSSALWLHLIEYLIHHQSHPMTILGPGIILLTQLNPMIRNASEILAFYYASNWATCTNLNNALTLFARSMLALNWIAARGGLGWRWHWHLVLGITALYPAIRDLEDIGVPVSVYNYCC